MINEKVKPQRSERSPVSTDGGGVYTCVWGGSLQVEAALTLWRSNQGVLRNYRCLSRTCWLVGSGEGRKDKTVSKNAFTAPLPGPIGFTQPPTPPRGPWGSDARPRHRSPTHPITSAMRRVRDTSSSEHIHDSAHRLDHQQPPRKETFSLINRKWAQLRRARCMRTLLDMDLIEMNSSQAPPPRPA